MKTYPSQRHFAVPVAVAVSVHVLLLLGFRSPPRNPDHLKERRGIEVLPAIAVEDFSPPDLENTGPSSKTQNPGDSVPAEIDHPQIESPDAVPVPIETSDILTRVPRRFELPSRPPGDGGMGIPGRAIFRADQLDAAPQAVSQLAPFYPDNLRMAGITGTVTVTFLVDENGRVHDPSVVSASRSEFADPALRAVSRWRFQPGKHSGRAVSFRMSVPLNFVLNP